MYNLLLPTLYNKYKIAFTLTNTRHSRIYYIILYYNLLLYKYIKFFHIFRSSITSNIWIWMYTKFFWNFNTIYWIMTNYTIFKFKSSYIIYFILIETCFSIYYSKYTKLESILTPTIIFNKCMIFGLNS